MAALQFLGALVALVLGASATILGGAVLSGPAGLSIGTMWVALGAFFLVLGVAGIAIGVGLLRLRPWGRTLALGLAVITLILSIATAAIGEYLAILDILVSIGIMGYLMLPGVRAAFEAQGSEEYLSRGSYRLTWAVIITLMLVEGVLTYFVVNWDDYIGAAIVLTPMIILTGTLIIIFLGNYETEPPGEASNGGRR